MKQEPPLRPRRSLLFVPANRPERFEKALNSGADMVCLELEDGVAISQKDAAREHMLAFFDNQDLTALRPEVIVRINSLEEAEGQADLSAILALEKKPAGLMIPKIRSAQDVTDLVHLLEKHESVLPLHLLIETATALEDCISIARSSAHVQMLLFGGIDLAAELRCTTDWEPLLYARSRVVHAAACADIALMDMPYLRVDDAAGLQAEAIAARQLGYAGKAAIHPAQIQPIHDTFSPSDEEVAFEKKVMDAYHNAPSGVTVIDGRVVEKPVILKMQHILAIDSAIKA